MGRSGAEDRYEAGLDHMQAPRRVGTLIPSPNTVIETEFNHIMPPHYQLHAGRLRMGPIDEVGWRMQDADIDYQAELLGSAKVELIILAQTAVSYFDRASRRGSPRRAERPRSQAARSRRAPPTHLACVALHCCRRTETRQMSVVAATTDRSMISISR
jgi:maleate cis-trans isomerase